jgi:hypothetical protein
MKNRKLFIAMTAIAIASLSTTFGIDDCGCRPKADRPVVLLNSSDSRVDANGNLLGDVYFDCDSIYQLELRTYVQSGNTLTIEPGTIIWGKVISASEGSSALIVERDAKIYAVGKEDCPIIMTTVNDRDLGTQDLCLREQWGGLVICGRAYNNLIDAQEGGSPVNESAVADGLGTIEGFVNPEPRVYYGADLDGDLGTVETFDNDDNSGHIQYVSIRVGGSELGSGNEINGLTLGSVGRKTIISHVEVVSNLDDGIEFFGGTVDIKFAMIMIPTDDYFDWDQGYTGRGQFLYGIQSNNSYVELDGDNKRMGDNGLEIDGHDDEDYDGYLSGRQMSHPHFANVTIIGNNHDSGIEAKENTEGIICNSVFAKFAVGANIYDQRVEHDAYENWTGGSLEIFGNSFVDCGSLTNLTGGDLTSFQGDNCELTSAQVGWDINYDFDCPFTVTDQLHPVPTEALIGNLCYDEDCVPEDDFFTVVDYSGAFEPGAEPWTKGWTTAESRGFDWSIVDCPEDVDGSGTIGLSDLTDIASKFGQSCGN